MCYFDHFGVWYGLAGHYVPRSNGDRRSSRLLGYCKNGGSSGEGGGRWLHDEISKGYRDVLACV